MGALRVLLYRLATLQSSAMSKIANNTGYHTSVTTIEALCKFFDCKIEDILEYVPDDH